MTAGSLGRLLNQLSDELYRIKSRGTPKQYEARLKRADIPEVFAEKIIERGAALWGEECGD
jgi:hypothetical protein